MSLDFWAMASVKKIFTEEDFQRGKQESNLWSNLAAAEKLTHATGLAELDAEIAKSRNLQRAAPIKLIAVGGFVAVTYFHNRETTQDLDCLLDPTLKNRVRIE
jgi:hypothetical protein